MIDIERGGLPDEGEPGFFYANTAPYLVPEPITSYVAYTKKTTTLNFGAAIDNELNPIEITWDVGDLAPYVRVD